MSKYSLSECKTLIENNISVVVADQYKKPLWSAWQSKQITFTQFSRYYKKADAKITGIVCTNNIECIDVDLKILPESKRDSEFKKMITFFADQIDDFHKKFFVQRTPSKGFHIVYKCKFTESNKKIAFVETESDKFECLIETRGSGGYFGIYKNLNIFGSAFNIPEITTHERDIIMHCCESFNEKLKHEKVSKQAIKDHSESTITPWDDYDSKTDVFDVVQSIFDIVGKTPKGYQIKRIGGSKSSHHSGYIYTDRNIMFLFSGNSIFPAEVGLSPSACLAHRDFNGDFAECAKYLYDQGFGDRKPTAEIERVEMPSSGEFPIDIFPEWVGQYINEIHQASGIPVDFLASAFLFSFSIICGNSFGIQKRTGSLEFPIIWICLVAKAGRFKSPAIDEMILPLRKLNIEMHKEFAKAVADIKQMKLNKQKGQNVDDDDLKEPRKQMTVVDDVTIEALMDLHQNNTHGIGYVKDELAGMMQQFSKYNSAGSDVSYWLSIFNGGSVSLERKTQGKSAFVEKTFVPIIGGIQPAIIHSIVNATNRHNGLVDRFLFVSNDDDVPMLSNKKVRPFKKKKFVEMMSSAYATLKNINSSPLELTDDADDQLVSYINKMRSNQNNDDLMALDGLNAKMQTYLHRFTALLHIMNDLIADDNQIQIQMNVTSVIHKKTVDDAWRLAQYFINQGAYVREKTSVDLEKVEVMKQLKLKGASTRREMAVELYKKYNGDITYQEIAELVGYKGKQAVWNVISKDNACRKLKDAKSK